ncbi:MAG: methyl-accepting chemotaxis sensory transducer [Paenibacillus sp.]|jgi:methyl-accepting chemotaxis protein|nr:methyl-accepting chemotaxis sensory transducer [Paenibacillus sp.]
MMTITSNKEGIRLLDYARPAPVVREESLCKDLLDIFQENSDCECIVMTSDLGGISGLAMRNRFSYKLAHRYSVALFYNKPALQLADREPIIVDAEATDPRELIDLAMSRQDDSLYDCIIVVSQGRYAGVLAISDLLRLSKELQLQAIIAQKETLRSAKQRIEGIEEAVESVRQSVQNGETLSHRMVDLTLQGKSELNVIQESFQTIERSSAQQEERMRELERETGSIGVVSRLIKELAEQCNILAINASIEAARAGEYGRGFSVVAGEFMNLANQTKKSALEITGITDNIVQSISRAAEHVDEGRKLTASSGKNVEAANGVYQDIFKAAADNRDSSRQIGELARVAHHLAAEVAQEMEELRRSYS